MIYVRKVQHKKVENLREKFKNSMKKLIDTIIGLIVLSIFVFVPMISQAQLNSILIGEEKTNINSTNTVDTIIENDLIINTKTDENTSPNLALEESLEDDEGLDSNSNFSLKINSSGVAVLSSSQVSSEDDLDVFSANVSAKDKEIANVDINFSKEGESEVKVIYRHKGKLLGFIPVAINSTTVVENKNDSETEVRSKLSWWSFLVTDQNYAKADVESSIKNNNAIKANAKVNSSAQAKAQIAEVVIAEVEAHANAQASTDK